MNPLRLASDRRAANAILQGNAWQEYGYKFGYWQYQGPLWSIPLLMSKNTWWRSYKRFQLIDLKTGKPVGEMWARDRNLIGLHRMRRHSGTLEFAGNPALVGVYRLSGHKRVVFTHSRYSRHRWAAKEARSMTTGPDPSRGFVEKVRKDRLRELPYGLQMDVFDGSVGLLETMAGENVGQPWIADVPY